MFALITSEIIDKNPITNHCHGPCNRALHFVTVWLFRHGIRPGLLRSNRSRMGLFDVHQRTDKPGLPESILPRESREPVPCECLVAAPIIAVARQSPVTQMIAWNIRR